MNPLSRLLPQFSKSGDDVAWEDLPRDEQLKIEAEDRAARIQWHRDHVRNGPSNFVRPTNGQVRRAQTRFDETRQRKMNKNHRRSFFAKQQQAASLRGQLQAVGAIPYATPDLTPTTSQRVKAGTWISQHFGERYEQDTSDEIGFHEAGTLVYDEDLFANALRAALAHYGKLTGQEVAA